MSEFVLSDSMNNEKCFILKRSEIEKRLDPFYYVPSIKKLDNKIQNKGAKPLRYFIENISSGATPKTSEKEKYYSDEETHNNYLKRSQVSGGDLLVKITGVGRMAVASVAPDGFIGNTNQHMAVIKTKDRQTSEILASYLNTDIGEMLASRRATGGTRPALDYPALLSIPIIFDNKILEIYKLAIESKQQKEKQAKDLLDSIDTYLLEVLDINLSEVDNSLEKRKFEINLNELSGNRFDCDYYSYKYEILQNTILKAKTDDINIDGIESVVSIIKGGKTPASHEYSDTKSEFPIIKAGSYTDEYINLNKLGYTKEENNFEVQKGDIFILSAAHQSHYVGRQIKILNDNIDIKISYVGELICIRTIEELCNPMYMFSLLNLEIYKTLLNREKTGQTSHIYGKDIKKIKIPIPTIKKQNKIAKHIQNIRDNAKKLKIEAVQDLENAKKEVEKMVLG